MKRLDGWSWALLFGRWILGLTFFMAGWFTAFCRNFVIAVSIWSVRARAELASTRDFLDHI